MTNEQKRIRERAKEIRKAWGICRQQSIEIATTEEHERKAFYNAIIQRAILQPK